MNRKRNKVDMEKIFAIVISLSIMIALVVGVMSILKSNKSESEDKRNYIDLNEIDQALNEKETDNETLLQAANEGGTKQNETESAATQTQRPTNGENDKDKDKDKTLDMDSDGADEPTSKEAETPTAGANAGASQEDSESGNQDVAAASGDEGAEGGENPTDAQQVAVLPEETTPAASGEAGQEETPTDEAAQGQEPSGEVLAADNGQIPGGEIPSDEGETQPPEGEVPAGENLSDDATPVNAGTAALLGYSFGEESTLMWPAQGNVILNYNMTNTIYFPTLDVYKCNPAIIIGAEEGAVVSAAADGIVMAVYETKETGITMQIAVGNDYVLTYGQLKDLVVGVGSQVKRGDVIGSVAAPSQYYAVEGSNLYFRVDNAEGPVNPMDFIE